MLPGDRLLCALVRPQPIGGRFASWPLHVTVVPWFRLADSSDAVAAGLAAAVATIATFEARAGEAVRLGPKKNRPARLVRLPTAFMDIEPRVRKYFHKKRAWLVDETTKRRHDYRPHVTFQQAGELGAGQTFHVERLYIIEQKGDYKEIVADIRLGAQGRLS